MASIDVVVPCYQYGRFLRDCVSGILDQGIEDLRVLIVDNASTDDSVAIAKQLAAEDSRIEVLARERNLGHHASFNAGVDWAKADYFAVVHADDILTPGSFRRAISFMERHPEVGFTIGPEIDFQDGQALPRIAPNEAALWRIFNGPDFVADRSRKLCGGPIVVRTAVQKKAGHYRKEIFFVCDVDMLLRLVTFGSAAETSAAQGYRRWHGAHLVDVHKIDQVHIFTEFEAVFRHFFEHEGRALEGAERLERLAKRNLVETAYWWGVHDLRKGKWRTGLDLLRFALARAPHLAVLPPVGFLFAKHRPLQRLAQAARELVRPGRQALF